MLSKEDFKIKLPDPFDNCKIIVGYVNFRDIFGEKEKHKRDKI